MSTQNFFLSFEECFNTLRKRERASKQTASIVAENDKDGIVVIDMEDVSQLPYVKLKEAGFLQSYENLCIERWISSTIRRFKGILVFADYKHQRSFADLRN